MLQFGWATSSRSTSAVHGMPPRAPRARQFERRHGIRERQHVLDVAVPCFQTRGGRSHHERRRRRRCCRRSRPETPACGFRVRCTAPDCPRYPASHRRAARRIRDPCLERPAKILVPVSAVGKSSAAMIASICCSSSAMPGRTCSTSIDRRHAGLARVARRLGRGGRLVAVDDQDAPAVTASLRNVSGHIVERRMAVPQHRALPGPRVDEHDGKLVGRASDGARRR